MKSFRTSVFYLFFISFSFLLFAQSSSDELRQRAQFTRDKGYEEQKAGRLDEALMLYQKAINIDPAYAAAYNDCGVIYEIQGDIKEAKARYAKCLELDKKCLSAYSNLALLSEEQDDFEKALQYWNKRAQLGDIGDSWGKKARARADEIRKKLGVSGRWQVMDKALDLEERKAMSGGDSYDAGEKRVLPQEIEAVVRALKAGNSIESNEKAKLYEKLGTAYVKAKLYNEAIDAYRNSLDASSDNAKLYYYLGLLYQYKRRDTAQALEHFNAYLKLDEYGQYAQKVNDLIKILK